jgi:hypothetical protein
MDHPLAHAPDLDRVRANTWHEVNERLDAQAAARIQSAAGDAADPSDQITELDREWDFDRIMETESSLMGLMGLALGIGVHKRFLFISGFVAGMILLHSVHGWYPLLPLFRRMGVRTRDEIDRERNALKALRGDFAGLPGSGNTEADRAAAAWRAVCA